jgi:hypothetical protein
MQFRFEQRPQVNPARRQQIEKGGGYSDPGRLEAAYKKAVGILESDRISLDGFRDLYGADIIQNDQNAILRTKAGFAREADPEKETAKKLATIFEAIIHEQAELSDWLGPDAHTITPSEYDDIKNGVDSIVEFREEHRSASHLALGIDVTFGHYARWKLSKIKEDIRNGALSRIKYFSSEYMGFRGELKNVPRVVVGADIQKIEELMKLWLAGDKKRLGEHPVQLQILGEIRVQLRTFEEYAQEVGRPEIASIYSKTAIIIEKILSGKTKQLGITSPAQDKIFKEINSFLIEEFNPQWWKK